MRPATASLSVQPVLTLIEMYDLHLHIHETATAQATNGKWPLPYTDYSQSVRNDHNWLVGLRRNKSHGIFTKRTTMNHISVSTTAKRARHFQRGEWRPKGGRSRGTTTTVEVRQVSQSPRYKYRLPHVNQRNSTSSSSSSFSLCATSPR